MVNDPDLGAIRDLANSVIERYHTAFERFEVHNAMEIAWELVGRANALVEQKSPWKLAKEPSQSELLNAVLYTLAETVRLLALLVSPVIPASSEKIIGQLQSDNVRTLRWGGLPAGHQLGKPTPDLPKVRKSTLSQDRPFCLPLQTLLPEPEQTGHSSIHGIRH